MARIKTTPRKRPRQARAIATVDAILAATARVLLTHGYDRASTNKIAEVAGVSVGSLYEYFPSKEALVAALAQRHAELSIEMIVAKLAEVAVLPLRKAARTLVDGMLALHAIDPKLHAVLAEQAPRIGRLKQLDDIDARAMELVRGLLELRKKELRPRDLDLATFVIVHTVESLTHAATLHSPERLRDEALAEEITELVVRYLAP